MCNFGCKYTWKDITEHAVYKVKWISMKDQIVHLVIILK